MDCGERNSVLDTIKGKKLPLWVGAIKKKEASLLPHSRANGR